MVLSMTLFIRLAIVAFPNPEDTITVGTAGCGRLAISQAAIPFVYGNYGDQNGVASGLSRGLRIRFGDQPKDVVVMAGDGGTADIGFQQVLHSWFRKERFTTIMKSAITSGHRSSASPHTTASQNCKASSGQ